LGSAAAFGDQRKLKPHRLLLLACSQRKRGDEGWIKAIDRYNGPLWQTLRVADPRGDLAQVAVLSALYGLRDARFHDLPDYNCVLTDAAAAAMIEGGVTTRWPKTKTRNGGAAPAGIHPAAEIASMCFAAGRPFRDVAIVGGQRYVRVLMAWLADFRSEGWIGPDARITIINGPVGIMRQQLRQWLDATPSNTVAAAGSY